MRGWRRRLRDGGRASLILQGDSPLSIERRGDVAHVVLDTPGSTVNTFGTAAIAAFERAVGEIEADPPRVVVLRSAKADVFLAGADLDELETLAGGAGGDEAAHWLERGQRALERWRRLPAATVAWIDGATLGGGVEVALACRHRVASDRAVARFGMPEVQLGLVTALGGSFDVPRVVGLRRGLELLLTGRQLSARRALEWGLIDDVVPSAVGERAAIECARRGAARQRGVAAVPDLWRWPILRSFFLKRAGSLARRRARGFDAPERLLDCVAAGLGGGRGAAEAEERKSFGFLAAGAASRSLVGLFRAGRAEGASDPSFDLERPVGVVGGGFMGSGIARAAAARGLRVRVHDRRPEALARLVSEAARGGGREARSGRRLHWRLTTTLEARGFSRCDLVIEAVSEDLETKHAVLREIESQVREVAVLASNTSTLPIAQIAKGLRYPNRVLGLHFFSPVDRMPLVEVVRHATAGDPFVARARSFVRSLGKTPVVVRDGPGFFTTRVLAPYLAQGARLVGEGAAIAEVDAAARAFGFPVGPLELLDEVGLDIAAAAGATLNEAFADRMPSPRDFRRLIENGRLGRKVGRGFYDYRGRRKRPDSGVEELLRSDEAQRAPTREAMGERLAWSLIGEAWRALADGVVANEMDGDLAAVLGIGFPAWRGGPFRFVRLLPAGEASLRLRRLAELHGPPFGALDDVLPRG